jgi:hypothetical protein
MGRIAGESRGDARVRRLCIDTIQALHRLVRSPETDPAIVVRAAAIVARTFLAGERASIEDASTGGQRITWEEYVRGVRALDKAEPGPSARDGTVPRPDGPGDPARIAHVLPRRSRQPAPPQE